VPGSTAVVPLLSVELTAMRFSLELGLLSIVNEPPQPEHVHASVDGVETLMVPTFLMPFPE
jgi:hypothetical protein